MFGDPNLLYSDRICFFETPPRMTTILNLQCQRPSHDDFFCIN